MVFKSRSDNELGAIDFSETAWPAVPDGDDIRPPNTSATAVAYDKPPADDAGKVARASTSTGLGDMLDE